MTPIMATSSLYTPYPSPNGYPCYAYVHYMCPYMYTPQARRVLVVHMVHMMGSVTPLIALLSPHIDPMTPHPMVCGVGHTP